MLRLFLLCWAMVPVLGPSGEQSPYAGEESRQVKSLSEKEIASLRRGDGMGFAKLAELNHYPGPKHVLELADGLELTEEQLTATQELYEEMRREAIALGEQLLAAEARLDQQFAEQSIRSDSLATALLEIGELRARLRFVHLEAHLRQTQLLQPEQVQQYDRLRGYRRHQHRH